MPTCKCGKRFHWALTPTGGKAPITAEPSKDGNVLLLAPTDFGPLAVTLSKDALDHARAHGVRLRLNHFADRPDRAEFEQRPGGSVPDG